MSRSALILHALWALSALWCASAEAAERTESRAYAADPDHLWNRLHATLFVRTGPDGVRYGEDRLDPLLWSDTKYLLEGNSHLESLEVLDEFLAGRGEKLIHDPLKRAFLQRDLWTLFDWSFNPYEPGHASERAELQKRVGPIMQRLALTKSEMESLPDNYRRAEENGALASLPRGLFDKNADWLPIGDASGAVAPAHLADFGGRSVFEVFLRLPGGHGQTLSYFEKLRSFNGPRLAARSAAGAGVIYVFNPDTPQFPVGTRWVLVRRMCVIDGQGQVRATRVVESVQEREYVRVPAEHVLSLAQQPGTQQVREFVASRAAAASLRPIREGERDFTFVQFRSVGVDSFESARTVPLSADEFGAKAQNEVLRTCFRCHGQTPGIASVGVYGPLFRTQRPELLVPQSDREANETLAWKQRQPDFEQLMSLWPRAERAAE